eukprot:GHVQ01010059.1.p1 GENE.GHVQ01010059.1~~GHVQ01010059.1.p1  ORF type:complete len:149 (-),score=29.28 GHVQ01010059.1:158-604(-)
MHHRCVFLLHWVVYETSIRMQTLFDKTNITAAVHVKGRQLLLWHNQSNNNNLFITGMLHTTTTIPHTHIPLPPYHTHTHTILHIPHTHIPYYIYHTHTYHITYTTVVYISHTTVIPSTNTHTHTHTHIHTNVCVCIQKMYTKEMYTSI